MVTRRAFFCGILGGVVLTSASGGLLFAAAPKTGDDPVALVQRLSDAVLAYLKAHPVTDEPSREALVAFVEANVLPFFDMPRMTALAVGPAWRQATPEQRAQLTEEFKKLLLRTYSNAAKAYKDETLEFLPQRGGANDPVVRVAARIVRAGSEPIEVQYVLQNRGDGWRIFDVVIAGVSLVTNYRGSFAAEINRGGIDGLIRTLAEKNAKGETDPVPVPEKGSHG
ncbi:exported protein [Hydrogenophilus thermoluteolus]|uniref:MlaC/ttg2D family ABC transporter substrate-binding protein n=1 Tax=Hydrogenophilus thermoluteolus TaxID=297 RepID=UPI0024A320FF|nr:ABC transporter substrate-binding protein [Hydrogenophilus thermoluteolus]GLW59838.1 exported protein [Hydrogenophilus thermoluteolus]